LRVHLVGNRRDELIAIFEMAVRSVVRYTDSPRETPNPQTAGTIVANCGDGLVDEGLAQMSVVIRRIGHTSSIEQLKRS